MQLFYKSGELATLMGTGQTRCLFKVGRLPLVLFCSGESAKILANDRHHSPCLHVELRDSVCVQFSAYGYTATQPPLICGFNGAYQDVITGCYLLGNGYRAYNPRSHRFNSPDSDSPMGFGGINAYAYVSGDPVNRQDPSGHFPGHASAVTVLSTYLAKAKQQIASLVFPTDAVYVGRGSRIHGIDVFSKDDLKTGRDTLFIKGHGGPGYINGKHESYNGPELFQLLREHGVRLKGRETHTLVCRSAIAESATRPSLNQALADLTGVRSTGYEARVKVDAERARNTYRVQVNQPELYEQFIGTHTQRPTTISPAAHRIEAAARSIRATAFEERLRP